MKQLFWWVAYAVGCGAAARADSLQTKGGVVAADHVVASKVGATVLAQGGNAVDAAIATALSLGVVNPTSSGIGGGGFAVVYVAQTKQVHVYDFREVAPRALGPANFAPGGTLRPELATRGGLAVGVPGEVAGLQTLSKLHGALPWADAVKPAALLAERGFPVSAFLHGAASGTVPRLATDPSARRLVQLLAPNGRVVAAGQTLRRRDLARTLRRIAKAGAAGFYEGVVAGEIVAASTATGGVLTKADLASYVVATREPLWGTWRGYRVATMPLPSSGGVVLLEVLGLLQHLPWDISAMTLLSVDRLHLLGETMKVAFADRARWLGDTNAARQRVTDLLRPERLAQLAAAIARDFAATPVAAAVPRSDHGTSHLCVIDKAGNAVALTTTVNGYFGSKVVTAGGVVLNNQMDDFTLAPGAVNQFGLVQSADNLVAPGKRPLSSMTPTLVLDDNGVVACVGGSGGPYIISGVLQVLLASLAHNVSAAAAVAVPRVHHQWSPNELVLDPGIDNATQQELVRRGHMVRTRSGEAVVQYIRVLPDGTRDAASDPKKGGAPWAAPTK